eukprot:351761-Chlamydomonas_euryale.AAC.5
MPAVPRAQQRQAHLACGTTIPGTQQQTAQRCAGKCRVSAQPRAKCLRKFVCVCGKGVGLSTRERERRVRLFTPTAHGCSHPHATGVHTHRPARSACPCMRR